MGNRQNELKEECIKKAAELIHKQRYAVYACWMTWNVSISKALKAAKEAGATAAEIRELKKSCIDIKDKNRRKYA